MVRLAFKVRRPEEIQSAKARPAMILDRLQWDLSNRFQPFVSRALTLTGVTG